MFLLILILLLPNFYVNGSPGSATHYVSLASTIKTESNQNDISLISAIQKGRIGLVKNLLSLNDTKENIANPKVWNHYAIRKASEIGFLEGVKELLNWKGPKGECVDPRDERNEAIVLASKNGHIEVVKELLAWNGTFGERVNPTARDNEAVRLASQNGHIEVVHELLHWNGSHDQWVDPTAKDYEAFTNAIYNCHIEVAKKLLDWRGPNGQWVDPRVYDDWAIRYASEYGYNDLVRSLLDWQGPDGEFIDATSTRNEALRFAGINGHVEVVKMLLAWKSPGEEKVDLDTIDDSLKTLFNVSSSVIQQNIELENHLNESNYLLEAASRKLRTTEKDLFFSNVDLSNIKNDLDEKEKQWNEKEMMLQSKLKTLQSSLDSSMRETNELKNGHRATETVLNEEISKLKEMIKQMEALRAKDETKLKSLQLLLNDTLVREQTASATSNDLKVLLDVSEKQRRKAERLLISKNKMIKHLKLSSAIPDVNLGRIEFELNLENLNSKAATVMPSLLFVIGIVMGFQ